MSSSSRLRSVMSRYCIDTVRLPFQDVTTTPLPDLSVCVCSGIFDEDSLSLHARTHLAGFCHRTPISQLLPKIRREEPNNSSYMDSRRGVLMSRHQNKDTVSRRPKADVTNFDVRRILGAWLVKFSSSFVGVSPIPLVVHRKLWLCLELFVRESPYLLQPKLWVCARTQAEAVQLVECFLPANQRARFK